MVSGGNAPGALFGSMFHKDAHSGPGGLYGPGGQLEGLPQKAMNQAAAEGYSLGYSDPYLPSTPSYESITACEPSQIEGICQLPNGAIVIDGQVQGDPNIDWVGVACDLVTIGASSVGGAGVASGPMSVIVSGSATCRSLQEALGQ